jgi:hypothetical protein
MTVDWKRAITLFGVVYLGHALCPISTQGDSRWNVPTALSLLSGAGFDLRAYQGPIAASGFYGVECVVPGYVRVFPVESLDQCTGGHIYNFYPLAVPLVSLPFVAALRWLLPAGPAKPGVSPRVAFFQGDLAAASGIVEILVASAFVAGTAVVLYWVAREALPAGGASALALLFAFGTSAWSVGSRALWQHSPSMLLNSIVLLCLILLERWRGAAALAGFAMALAYYVRPTNVVPAAVFGIYLVLLGRRHALEAIAGAIPVVAAFTWIYLGMYGMPLAPYFLPGKMLRLHSEIPVALAANLVSPARGLFIFMPFLLALLLPGPWRTRLPGPLGTLRPWMLSVVLLQMVVIASHDGWWGGFSYGPRYLSDMLPYLMALWIPVPLAYPGRAARAAIGALVLASFLIHLRGATSIAVHNWNSTPVSVNEHRERIWDWRDPPFLRGLWDRQNVAGLGSRRGADTPDCEPPRDACSVSPEFCRTM